MNNPISEQFITSIYLQRDKIHSYKKYPFNLTAVKNLETLKFHPSVTFLVGENGSGKSTLLEAIATEWGFNPEGGSHNFAFETRSSHSDLNNYIRLYKGTKRPKTGFFLRAESYYNFAAEVDRRDEDPDSTDKIIEFYGGKSLLKQSHGESFMALLTKRFIGHGLYMLDEPESALSPIRQMSMLVRMHELVQQGSQFIIATHSPILMAYPNAVIYVLAPEGPVVTEYKETEHYQVTKAFLEKTDVMLKELKII